MCECMRFPETVEEFMEQYKIVDTEQIYTNGVELVPIFRMQQWFEHLSTIDVQPVVRGKWLATAGWGKDKCSNCGFVIDWDDVPSWLDKAPHFSETCPNCGADMRGDIDSY